MKTNQELLDIEKLHVLLRIAIDDLKTCISTPGYVIDMDNWVYHRDNTCYVCLAGAVMVQNLKDLGVQQTNWAQALDSLRTGDLIMAWCLLGDRDDHSLAGPLEDLWLEDPRRHICLDSTKQSTGRILECLEARYDFLKQKDI